MQNAVNCNEFSDPWVIMFFFLLPIFQVAISKSALTCRRSFISCGLSFVSYQYMQASLLNFFSKLDGLAETFLDLRSECYTSMCRHQSGMKIIFYFSSECSIFWLITILLTIGCQETTHLMENPKTQSPNQFYALLKKHNLSLSLSLSLSSFWV